MIGAPSLSWFYFSTHITWLKDWHELFVLLFFDLTFSRNGSDWAKFTMALLIESGLGTERITGIMSFGAYCDKLFSLVLPLKLILKFWYFGTLVEDIIGIGVVVEKIWGPLGGLFLKLVNFQFSLFKIIFQFFIFPFTSIFIILIINFEETFFVGFRVGYVYLFCVDIEFLNCNTCNYGVLMIPTTRTISCAFAYGIAVSTVACRRLHFVSYSSHSLLEISHLSV